MSVSDSKKYAYFNIEDFFNLPLRKGLVDISQTFYSVQREYRIVEHLFLLCGRNRLLMYANDLILKYLFFKAVDFSGRHFFPHNCKKSRYVGLKRFYHLHLLLLSSDWLHAIIKIWFTTFKRNIRNWVNFTII